MYHSLIARFSALALAGLVSLSILAGIDQLAAREHAGDALAEGRTTPAQTLAASAAQTAQL